MMDGLTPPFAAMPPPAPLAMPPQDLRVTPPRQVPVPRASRRTLMWRAIVFGSAGLALTLLLVQIGHWLAMGGLMALEMMLLALIGLTAIWILLTVATALAGLHALIFPPRTNGAKGGAPLSTALLVPVYNENTAQVFGNAAAMLRDLSHGPMQGQIALFILSDTQDEDIALREWRGFQALQATLPGDIAVYYRRRVPNTDRKVGNIRDWIEKWGGDWESFIVLDADSLMAGDTITALRHELAADRSAGLIQSFPRLIGAHSLFGRLQQFSNAAYGFLLAEGLSRWSGSEGNYWGHNAIIRTRAFAASAGLPHLRGRGGRSQMIWSHDFVEAALLRRAGWRVRFLPRISGSYEESPPTLIDHVLRDRRWCQGNLQHLRLLGTRGLHPVSRFHMFHGAVAYLMSPAWFVLLLIWASLGTGHDTSVISYFSDTNPLYPMWPELDGQQSVLFLSVMYGMLLAPKLLGIVVILLSGARRRSFGGVVRFLPTALAELLGSIAYAPVQMVQQTQTVLRIALGLRVGWTPQNRDGSTHYTLATFIKFHFVETFAGAVLLAGMVTGLVSVWLLPIALSLCAAIPLSMLSGVVLPAEHKLGRWLASPQHITPPRIWRHASDARENLRVIEATAPAVTAVAAE